MNRVVWLRRVSPSSATHAFGIYPVAWRAGYAARSYCGLITVDVDNAKRDRTTARCELCVRAVNRRSRERGETDRG